MMLGMYSVSYEGKRLCKRDGVAGDGCVKRAKPYHSLPPGLQSRLLGIVDLIKGSPQAIIPLHLEPALLHKRLQRLQASVEWTAIDAGDGRVLNFSKGGG